MTLWPLRKPDVIIAILVSLTHLLITGPWLYYAGAGEPDSIAMITGVYQGLLKQTYFKENLYMLVGQPLYYGIFFAFPGLKLLSFDQLALFMNGISWVASATSSGLLYLLLRKFTGRFGALTAALVLLSSPTIFEWSTYTHPVTVSIALFLCSLNLTALVLFRQGNAVDQRPIAVTEKLLLIASALIAGAAVCVRADILVLFHLFVFMPWLATSMWKRDCKKILLQSLVGCGVGLAAAIIGFSGIALFVSAPVNGSDNSPSALFQTVKTFFNLMPLQDGLLELVFGIGVLGALYFAFAILMAAAARRWQPLLILFLLIAPPLIFAMGNPQPARRFMHAVYAATIGLGVLWTAMPALRTRTATISVAVICGVVAFIVNIIWLPIAGKLLRESGFGAANRYLFSRATGSLLNHHDANQHYLLLVERQMDSIRRYAPKGSLLVGSYAHLHFLSASFSRDRIPVETELIQQDQRLFITRVRGGSSTFFVAEYLPQINPSPPALNYPAVYKLTPVLLDASSTSAPITILAPPRGSEFQMWYRP